MNVDSKNYTFLLDCYHFLWYFCYMGDDCLLFTSFNIVFATKTDDNRDRKWKKVTIKKGFFIWSYEIVYRFLSVSVSNSVSMVAKVVRQQLRVSKVFRRVGLIDNEKKSWFGAPLHVYL